MVSNLTSTWWGRPNQWLSKRGERSERTNKVECAACLWDQGWSRVWLNVLPCIPPAAGSTVNSHLKLWHRGLQWRAHISALDCLSLPLSAQLQIGLELLKDTHTLTNSMTRWFCECVMTFLWPDMLTFKNSFFPSVVCCPETKARTCQCSM